MKTFLISYDLGLPETRDDYISLFNYIKDSFIYWARPVRSVWIVKSDKTAPEIRDQILPKVDNNDKLIVVEIVGNWGTYNIPTEVVDWMKNNI